MCLVLWIEALGLLGLGAGECTKSMKEREALSIKPLNPGALKHISKGIRFLQQPLKLMSSVWVCYVCVDRVGILISLCGCSASLRPHKHPHTTTQHARSYTQAGL